MDPIRVAILTISDRSAKGERADSTGPALITEITKANWLIAQTEIIPDDIDLIQQKLINMCSGDIDIIFTAGGTGFSPRDVTPEATRMIVHRTAPGLTEAMRAKSIKITQHAMLSRAVAGIRDRTLIINLPGSPNAALQNLRVILPVLPHAVELMRESPKAELGHNKFPDPQ